MRRNAFQRIGFASSLLSVLTWLAPHRAVARTTDEPDDAFSWTLAPGPQHHFAFEDLNLDNSEEADTAIALASRFTPRVIVHDELDRPISATAFFGLAGNDRGPEDVARLQQQLDQAQQLQPNGQPNSTALHPF